MTKTRFAVLTLTAAVLLTSCAPVYKCGQKKPAKEPFLWSRNMKTVIYERDKLCTDLDAQKRENTKLVSNVGDLTSKNKTLTDQVSSMTTRNSELQKNYSDLLNESLSRTDQLNRALKAKNDELNQKEQELLEREKAVSELQKTIARQDSITKRLDGILRNALLGFNSDELSVEVINGKVYVSMSDRLLFRSGSSAVEDKGKEALKLLADVLNKNQEIDILVEGHTDNIPIKTAVYKDNWDLSVARATTIVRILTSDYKLIPERMTASGKGEFLPRADNQTTDGRAKNRRTEIILSPKLDEIMQLLRN
jgi:chemotaxis protein MotB